MLIKLEKLDSSLFDWSTWRAGGLLDLGIMISRAFYILQPENKEKIRKHAIGYCKSENAPCRPKRGQYCVMYQLNGVCFWSHLMKEEFEEIFKEEE